MFFYSCKSDNANKLSIANSDSLQNPARPKVDKLTFEEAFDLNYKISSLQTYTDTSNYIARVKNFVAFDKNYIFEVQELRQFEGLFLIKKIPIVEIVYSDTVFKDRGLLFEQNCYWFDGKNAKVIKELFKTYFLNNTTDTSCSNCLDKSFLRVEQNDRGKYSSITKEYFRNLNKQDKSFMTKINLLITNYKDNKHFFRLAY
jgi:hypothetical protein